jgi:hypothetical protein
MPGANRCGVRDTLDLRGASGRSGVDSEDLETLALALRLGHRCDFSPLRQARSVRGLLAELGKGGLNSLAQLIRHVVAASIGDHSAQLELE